MFHEIMVTRLCTKCQRPLPLEDCRDIGSHTCYDITCTNKIYKFDPLEAVKMFKGILCNFG